MKIQNTNKTTQYVMVVTIIVALSMVGLGILNIAHMGNANAQATTSPDFAKSSLGKPPFYILLNGSSVYPSYTVTRGQNIVIFVDIKSNQTYPVSLVTRQQTPDGILPVGMTMDIPVSVLTTPISHMPLHIHVPNNLTSGEYPMSIDAVHTSGAVRNTFQAGFNLLVTG